MAELLKQGYREFQQFFKISLFSHIIGKLASMHLKSHGWTYFSIEK